MNKKVTQIEAFNYFMAKKDFEMAADLLHNDFMSQGRTKEEFRSCIRNIGREFSGEKDLVIISAPCTCLTHKGLYGTSYIDTERNVFFNVVFQTRDGEIVDVSRCSSFKKPAEFTTGRTVYFDSVPTYCQIDNQDSVF